MVHKTTNAVNTTIAVVAGAAAVVEVVAALIIYGRSSSSSSNTWIAVGVVGHVVAWSLVVWQE